MSARVKRAKGPDAGKVLAALGRRFSPPAWCLLEQVKDGTGWTGSRWADALAMSLWPSRGLELHGIEIKVHRSDWLREIKKPKKAEAIFAYCHRFWLVSPVGVVADIGEIPPPWGWLELKGGRLYTRKDAPKLEPTPIDYPFVASILRKSADGMVPASSVVSLVDERVKEQRERWERQAPVELDNLRDSLKRIRADVEAFEKASGLSIRDGWNLSGPKPEEVGAAVKVVLGGDLKRHSSRLRVDARMFREIAEKLDEVVARVDGGRT